MIKPETFVFILTLFFCYVNTCNKCPNDISSKYLIREVYMTRSIDEIQAIRFIFVHVTHSSGLQEMKFRILIIMKINSARMEKNLHYGMDKGL